MSTVLVVPDILADVDPRGSLLGRTTLAVRVAADSPTALEEIGNQQPDLLLIGPGLSTSEIESLLDATRLAPDSETGPKSQRRLLSVAGARVIMLSTFADTSPLLLLDGLFAEVDAFLNWPTDPQDLSNALSWVLELSGRRAPRIRTSFLAHVEGLSSEDAEQMLASVVNLSEVGARVEAPHKLAVGSTGRVSFSLPGAPRRLALPCVVRALVDAARLHYGVEFTGLTSEDRSQLRGYVDRVLATKSATP